ncbi:diguanylate cyclase (GGDEF)-like protein [Krasilnikovia cinnamomea]|uniref:Diguanylate cyclase (GGDEF)-like protein n=1 Tax=Krasilnikovia cinnamomea TaxID=349313 RepID=A0A4Q7ZPP8_9ACTN|nr:GGDEF domain-containing protein [Krasilnikovia cinnamomea]RZU52704.1 diguanylate cyclase (GGDEF)-like protein [Krasilnikovia cinnamomea]
MDGVDIDVAQLSAALQALEEQVSVKAEVGYTTALELERQAAAVGDEMLIARARLVHANMLRRTGDVATAARQVHDIHEWALVHGDRRLQARTHLSWAYLNRLTGDTAQRLEHALSAVELLDETATPYMQVWYRCTLADALADNGDMDAARPRFRQAEALARELHQWEQLTMLLNNWAVSEYENDDFPRAREVAARMLEHAAAHGFDLEPAQLDTIGAIQIENGEYAEAEQTMLVCIARRDAGESDNADDLAEYLLNLARAQRGSGATDRAQASLDAARELCVDRELHGLLVRVHQEQAELHAARGEFAEAFAAQKVFVAAKENLRARQEQAKALTRQTLFETAEAREEAQQFREQARRDPLTGLRNRRFVDEELTALIAGDPDLTVAIADIDHFKQINDQLSHDTGDQVLVQVAKVLETELAAVAPEGFVARLGGEEFLLVLPATPVILATRHLDGIRRAISEFDWHDTTNGLPVTVSIGVAGVNETSPRSQSAALATADRNLYAAKHAGRNRVVAGTEPEPRRRAYRDRTAP